MGMKVSSFWFKVMRNETFNPDNVVSFTMANALGHMTHSRHVTGV